MSFGGLWEVSACPLDVSRMSWDVLRRSLGGSLQSLESPHVVFQSGFFSVFGVSSEGPVDPKNSIVFIRRDTILGVPF